MEVSMYVAKDCCRSTAAAAQVEIWRARDRRVRACVYMALIH